MAHLNLWGVIPKLLADLSRKTGINIITNVGWYAADNGRHLPREIKDMSAEEIALIWIGSKNGIGNTGIKPGVISIAIDSIGLSENDKIGCCSLYYPSGNRV